MSEVVEKIPATVLILTKNEARNIGRAIQSVSTFAQVLVVDSSSDDETVAIALSQHAEVVNFAWDGKYPKKKEWALAKAKHDWVVYLDADEFLTPELAAEIEATIKDDKTSAFDVPLRYYWMGRELRHGHQVRKRIGIRRSRCYWPRPDDLGVINMWEVEGHYQPQLRSGSATALVNKLGHRDEDGLYDYFARHNRYSDWEAHVLDRDDEVSVRARGRLGRIAARMPFKPIVFFLYSYVLRNGFRDGREGFDYAVALSFYYWQIALKVRELRLREES